MDYPGNSQRSNRPPEPERPKIEPIITSPIKRRKTPLGRRLTQNFIGGDVQSTREFVVTDIVVPTIRDLLLDVIRGAAERLIFPDAAPGRGRSSRHGGPINYAGMSGRGPSSSPMRTRSSSSSYSIDDIVFPSRAEAIEVCDRLEFYLDKYGIVAVGDLYGLVGIPTTPIDHNWGWKTLDQASIRHSRDGYILILPRPEYFK